MSSPPAASDNPWSSFPFSRDELVQQAREVLARAHSPYSGVRVGAVLVDDAGRTYSGCNVENASYGLTVCAERNAIGRAVADGAGPLVAVVIATNQARALAPCGACRQVLLEFAPQLVVVSAGTEGEAVQWSLEELLPGAFHAGDLPGHGAGGPGQ